MSSGSPNDCKPESSESSESTESTDYSPESPSVRTEFETAKRARPGSPTLVLFETALLLWESEASRLGRELADARERSARLARECEELRQRLSGSGKEEVKRAPPKPPTFLTTPTQEQGTVSFPQQTAPRFEYPASTARVPGERYDSHPNTPEWCAACPQCRAEGTNSGGTLGYTRH